MAQAAESHTPDEKLAKVLSETGETLFQFVSRQVDAIKARESKLGGYPGDGPTAEQADRLLMALEEVRPIFEIPESLAGVRPAFEICDPHEALQMACALPAVVFGAFRTAFDTEMSWLFPERDPYGETMTVALREVENITGRALEQARPQQASDLHRYADLAVLNNALRRQIKLHGNSPLWRFTFTCRMALARFLWWLGGGERRR